MCPILSTLFEAVGAIQVKQKEAKVAVASHGIEVFFFFFFGWTGFHTEKQRKKDNKAQNTAAHSSNTEAATSRYKESIKSYLAEEGVAP